MPVDGNPHPEHGHVQEAHPNILQGWQHDVHGVAPHVHEDFGLNIAHMAGVQEELQAQPLPDNMHNAWDDWSQPEQVQNNQVHDVQQQDADPNIQQQSISFDQSGSTAEYLRANGPDVILTIEEVLAGRNLDDVLAGRHSGSSSSSTSTDAASRNELEI